MLTKGPNSSEIGARLTPVVDAIKTWGDEWAARTDAETSTGPLS